MDCTATLEDDEYVYCLCRKEMGHDGEHWSRYELTSGQIYEVSWV